MTIYDFHHPPGNHDHTFIFRLLHYNPVYHKEERQGCVSRPVLQLLGPVTGAERAATSWPRDCLVDKPPVCKRPWEEETCSFNVFEEDNFKGEGEFSFGHALS